MLDSSDARTPGPAVGRPVVCSGGHASEHSLIVAQLLLLAWSRVKRYRVRPALLTRMLPSLVWRSDTLAARVACAPGVEGRAPATVAAVAAVAMATANVT